MCPLSGSAEFQDQGSQVEKQLYFIIIEAFSDVFNLQLKLFHLLWQGNDSISLQGAQQSSDLLPHNSTEFQPFPTALCCRKPIWNFIFVKFQANPLMGAVPAAAPLEAEELFLCWFGRNLWEISGKISVNSRITEVGKGL